MYVLFAYKLSPNFVSISLVGLRGQHATDRAPGVPKRFSALMSPGFGYPIGSHRICKLNHERTTNCVQIVLALVAGGTVRAIASLAHEAVLATPHHPELLRVAFKVLHQLASAPGNSHKMSKVLLSANAVQVRVVYFYRILITENTMRGDHETMVYVCNTNGRVN